MSLYLYLSLSPHSLSLSDSESTTLLHPTPHTPLPFTSKSRVCVCACVWGHREESGERLSSNNSTLHTPTLTPSGAERGEILVLLPIPKSYYS